MLTAPYADFVIGKRLGGNVSTLQNASISLPIERNTVYPKSGTPKLN
jgi:hypothetical protein